jgi:GDP-L-fucose synthase
MRYDRPAPVNLGSGQEISIQNLLTKIAVLTGFRGKVVWDTSRPNGQPKRCLDVSRAANEFGFRAVTPLEQGLSETIQWFRSGRYAERVVA